MNIAQNIVQLRESLPKGVSLVAVSKFHPVDAILEAYRVGQRIFGESRAQELKAKYAILPKDIEWHFIGPLQTNKVKDIIPFVNLIHSVDSLKLLQEINKQALKHERVIRILLEVHVAMEETKHGFTLKQCKEILEDRLLDQFPNVQICGLMGMASNIDDSKMIQHEFHEIKELFTDLKENLFKNDSNFKELSMGMSHDYQIALQEGSTLIRVGTSIFGEREY